MLKGAIFDMDGLLFDTERLYRDMWVALAKEYGQVPDPVFPKAVSGSNGAQMREIIHRYYPEVDAAVFQADCLERVKRQMDEEVPLKPGLFEMLDAAARNGLLIAVASSSPTRTIKDNLEHAHILSRFDAIVSGADVAAGKPAPDIFQLAARELGLKPEECYVFEDSINGIRAGVAAGCTTIMIPDLTEPTDELRAICSGIYTSLGEAAKALLP